MGDDEWLTVAEAVRLSGYHPWHLRELLRTGRIEARKFGPIWQVSRASLLTYLQASRESKDRRRGPKGEIPT